MKVHILYTFQEGPWGGGNQFLRGLRTYCLASGVYAENINDADIVLFNSNKGSLSTSVMKLCLLTCSNKALLVNRIDGPISMRNRGADVFDRIIMKLNDLLFAGCVFQSTWSYKQMQAYGPGSDESSVVIYNAANSDIFYPSAQETKVNSDKIRIIATSWSTNYEAKGFDIYEYLDQNLDFSRYEMTFVGRSPVEFSNIMLHPPASSDELGALLRKHDIYLTASVNDPCSNALIEGIASGLPAVVRNSGGHPELLGEGGVIFNDKEDVLEAIDTVAKNRAAYARNLQSFKFEHIGSEYCQYFEKILQRPRRQIGSLKKSRLIVQCLCIAFQIALHNMVGRIKRRILCS